MHFLKWAALGAAMVALVVIARQVIFPVDGWHSVKIAYAVGGAWCWLRMYHWLKGS